MIYLFHAAHGVRTVGDEDAANNLIRKGWEQIDSPPTIDEAEYNSPTFNGTDWVAVEKTTEEKAAYRRRRWLPSEFWLRFNTTEQTAIANSTNEQVRRFVVSALAADAIVSDAQTTLDGMSLLVAVGLVTEERKAEILDA